eukprot:gene6964-2645_t
MAQAPLHGFASPRRELGRDVGRMKELKLTKELSPCRPNPFEGTVAMREYQKDKRDTHMIRQRGGDANKSNELSLPAIKPKVPTTVRGFHRPLAAITGLNDAIVKSTNGSDRYFSPERVQRARGWKPGKLLGSPSKSWNQM